MWAQPFTSTVLSSFPQNYPEQAPHTAEFSSPPWFYPRSPSITRFESKVTIYERCSQILSSRHNRSILSHLPTAQLYSHLQSYWNPPPPFLGGFQKVSSHRLTAFSTSSFITGLSHHNLWRKQDFQGHSASLQLKDFTTYLNDLPHILLSCSAPGNI